MGALTDNPRARQQLASGLDALGISHDQATCSKLLRYLDLMRRWSQTQRLTAILDGEDMIERHLLDSLSINPWIQGQRVIDVGSGAGLPGIPLAIVHPGREFTLLDSQAKRCHFLFQVSVDLDLSQVAVVHSRVEDYHPEQVFDLVLSRAFASLAEFVSSAQHLCGSAGRLLAMKGRYPQAEIDAIQMPYNVVACHRLQIPGLDAERHLVELSVSKDGS